MMTKTMATIADAGKTTHTYRVVVEPDEDAWHAWCPALQGYGAATWGSTEAEALRHIQEVVAMVVAELIEDGETLPADEAGSAGTLVSVTI
jgi:predicted RNase H-like HicB family nuclease